MPKRKAAANPASVGVALIARDAQDTLGRCLDSIRPYVQQVVVGVDELTIDATKKVACRHGADVVRSVKVSDWHECQRHGRILAQHFANARNQSFQWLDPSLDWWLWVDADDVFEHGERIARVLESVPAECVGVWLPYRYATVGDGRATSTLFHRERFLRTSVGWDWVYRVHEVVKPRVESGGWFGTSELDIWHQEGRHRTEDSAQRNLTLLEIDYEQDPADSRTIFYIGNQYFAMNDNARAAEWYYRLVNNHLGNDYERWQAAVYMGHAHYRMGNLGEATQSAYLAMEEHPEHPEPYYLLAVIAAKTGNLNKTSFWTKLGRSMKEPPFFVFKNPMDYGFNNRVALADALAAEGYIDDARAEWEAAYAYYPDQRVADAIKRCDALQAIERKADAYVSFATYANGAIKNIAISEYERLPDDVRSFGRVRDVAVPIMLAHRVSSQPRIVFWCARSWEEWAPPKLNSTGLGGSETAVIEIADQFDRDGWRVDVYNGAGKYEGEYRGVGYWDPERYKAEPCDVFVSWRQPLPGVNIPNGARSLLWCHDLNYGPDVAFSLFDRVLGVSAWHARMLRSYYELDDSRVGYVPNGVTLRRFHGAVSKVPMRCVYASSADRGLLRLLELWPRIRAAEPGAELKIAYGWDTIDKMIATGARAMEGFKQQIATLVERTEGVEWLGRLPQDKLAELYQEAYAWLYPTHFLEVSCISAMEAMAGGAVPVTSACGALRETIGEAGLVVPGLVDSRTWKDFWVLQVLAVLTDPNLRKPLSLRAKKRASELTWDQSFREHWRPLVYSLLGAAIPHHEESPESESASHRAALLVDE